MFATRSRTPVLGPRFVAAARRVCTHQPGGCVTETTASGTPTGGGGPTDGPTTGTAGTTGISGSGGGGHGSSGSFNCPRCAVSLTKFWHQDSPLWGCIDCREIYVSRDGASQPIRSQRPWSAALANSPALASSLIGGGLGGPAAGGGGLGAAGAMGLGATARNLHSDRAPASINQPA